MENSKFEKIKSDRKKENTTPHCGAWILNMLPQRGVCSFRRPKRTKRPRGAEKSFSATAAMLRLERQNSLRSNTAALLSRSFAADVAGFSQGACHPYTS